VSRHTTPTSPEEAAFEDQCSGVCEKVLRTAILSLNREERQLLQHYFIAGLNIDRIGQVYVINRATAARRINRSVDRIRQKAHAELAAHFGRKNRKELNDLVASLYQHFNVDAQDLARS
jgi:DNA-directed RNA polymerase specialized sigma24 family protein